MIPGVSLIAMLVGVFYPSIESYKALGTESKDDDAQVSWPLRLICGNECLVCSCTSAAVGVAIGAVAGCVGASSGTPSASVFLLLYQGCVWV
jgi:hypothetical protein